MSIRERALGRRLRPSAMGTGLSVAGLVAAMLAGSAGTALPEEVASGRAADAAPLVVVCLDTPVVAEGCRAAVERWTGATGHPARVVFGRAEGRAALAAYDNLFSVESDRIDVIVFPDGWTHALADRLVTVPASPAVSGASGAPPAPSARSDGATAAATVAAADPHVSGVSELGRAGERTVGLPLQLAVGVLFYRSDIFSTAPVTWSSLRDRVLERARQGSTATDVAGLIFPAADAGELVQVAMEWLVGFGAPPLVDEAGRPAVDSARALAALGVLASLRGSVVPLSVLDLDMREARELFTSGKAMAMRGPSTMMPGLLSRDTPTSSVTGVTMVPRGEITGARAPVVLDVWFAGVSRFSGQREQALDLVRFMSSEETQRHLAVAHGAAPTLAALYRDPEVIEARPWLTRLGAWLPEAIVEPVAVFGAGWLEAVDDSAIELGEMVGAGKSPSEVADDLARSLSLILQDRRGS